ncbi:CRISPR-associated protein Cas4 [Candidatus Micrarchaeota archaeon CG10_big_fil_rev_8_21_14_0_10_45_29]|nr:MAG: CRISPR-associated protein Cas4 [Candidatus Micrarchaeota archaeon CG10_big_fil_rev_8_21_14_0_10_45_29]QBM01558.1 hypothetical protein [uncultured archaeon]
MLTARDVLNYLYCPRIIFYEKVLRQRQYETYKQIRGEKSHYFFKTQAKRKTCDEWKEFLVRLFEVTVKSSRIGFWTKADLIMKKSADEGRIVQFKPSIPSFGIPFAWKVQVCLEALCAEEMGFGKFSEGYIAPYNGGKPECFELDEGMRKTATETIKKVEKLIKDENFPEGTMYSARCRDCMYRGRMCEGRGW